MPCCFEVLAGANEGATERDMHGNPSHTRVVFARREKGSVCNTGLGVRRLGDANMFIPLLWMF